MPPQCEKTGDQGKLKGKMFDILESFELLVYDYELWTAIIKDALCTVVFFHH